MVESKKELVFRLKIIEAELYKSNRLIGKMQPFVEVETNFAYYLTKTAKNGGKKPAWNETLLIKYEHIT